MGNGVRSRLAVTTSRADSGVWVPGTGRGTEWCRPAAGARCSAAQPPARLGVSAWSTCAREFLPASAVLTLALAGQPVPPWPTRDTERAMSQENVEAFNRALAAYNRGNVEPMVEVSHPEIEWYPLSAEVEGGVCFRGHEGLRQWFANLHATFAEFEASVDDVRDLGDVVLALGGVHLRFRTGGILNTEAGYVSRFRDALAVWARMYPSHAEAFEAAGLRE
jgi:ketosteroid isomerase-like protein